MIILGVIGKILLTVLKILLILLVILLVLLLLILSAAIRWEAAGKADGESLLKGAEAKLKITWLFKLISAGAVYRGGDMAFQLKLAGFTIRKGARKASVEKPEEEEPVLNPESREEPEREPEPVTEKKPEPEAEKKPEPEAEKKPDTKTEEEKQVKTESEPEREEEPNTEPDRDGSASGSRSPADILADLADLLADRIYTEKDLCGGASDKAYALREKALHGYDKFLHILDLTQEESYRKTASLVLRQIRKILRHILPEVFRLKGVFGTGDPALTGQILGAVCALSAFAPEKWEIQAEGDFQDKQIRGKMYMKGRIRLIVIAGAVLRLLPDPNIRKLIIGKLFGKRSGKKGGSDGR